MKYRIADLLDTTRLQSVLDSVYTISKIATGIVDIDGTVHTESGWKDICTKFHRAHPDASRRCTESDLHISRHARDSTPYIIHECPHGLVDSAIPIVIEGEQIGSVFTGQIFLKEPDLDYFRSQARSYGFDVSMYIDAVKEVPVVPEETLRANLSFLVRFTDLITEMAVKHAREMEAVRRLGESEQRFRNIYRKNGSVMLLVDPESGRIEDANPAAAAFYGYPEDGLRAMTIDRIYAESGGETGAGWEAAIRKGPAHRICSHRLAGGEIRTVEVHTSSVEEEGRVLQFCVIRDLTEQRKLESQLLQAQKMETVGRLAGGIAHDFNNLLTAIIGYCDLALNGMGDADSLRGDMGEIRIASEKCASLTRQLLAFSRKQVMVPKVINLNDAVADMEKLLRHIIGEHIGIVSRLDDDLGNVKVDPAQLEQVILNLAVNARDAMPGGGKIVFKSGNADLDEDFTRGHPGANPGPYVMLSVSDTGCGMGRETLSRIFEPFFTTKERGTGLGLSTVYGIVKQCGGYILPYSEPGIGTTFKMYLPRVEEAVEKEMRLIGKRSWRLRGNENILLMEDEGLVGKLVKGVLGQHGYHVIHACSDDEAVELCRLSGGKFHMLLTDVIMPGMGGMKLSRKLERLNPGLKVLFMSGYTSDVIEAHGFLVQGVHFIQKPFTMVSLLRKVRGVLDSGSTVH